MERAISLRIIVLPERGEATMRARWPLPSGAIAAVAISLQAAKAHGWPNPFDMSKFTQIQQLLVSRLPTANASMEAVIVHFLPFSTAPNPSLENTLLTQLERVQAAFPANTAERASDEWIKTTTAQGSNKSRQGNMIRWMSLAGYDSPRFTRTVFEALKDSDFRLASEAAEAVGALRPPGGLERLSETLRKFPRTPHVIEAMAAYGTAALPYIPQLEAIALSTGDSRENARQAIAQIRDPSLRPLSKRLPRAVSLVDAEPAAPPTAPARGPVPTPVAEAPRAGPDRAIWIGVGALVAAAAVWLGWKWRRRR